MSIWKMIRIKMLGMIGNSIIKNTTKLLEKLKVKKIINEHVNMDDFLYEREVEWSIELTKDERIVAVHNTPFGNTKPIVSEEIEITGTPTMINKS
ncbi:hypothetical protein [Niallia taxi]|uniref:hypothetical protein n=1 Tax=Niallia taxi TaxID=2499688 RepID=UPI002E1B6CD7|nr:hypothetical protein [Niallia taxi]